MHPDLSKNARDKIEALCGLGCSQVNQLLEKASNENDIEELSEFSAYEISLIINELGDIMSVYDEK